MCYSVLLKEILIMTWNEISAYLATGALDKPDPELDVYRHLKVGLPAVVLDEAQNLTSTEIEAVKGKVELIEIPDLPTVPVGTPLNFKATLGDNFGTLDHLPKVILTEGPILTLDELDPPDLKIDVSAQPEASTGISEPYEDGAALLESGLVVLLDEKPAIHQAALKPHVELATVEELVEALKPLHSSKPTIEPKTKVTKKASFDWEKWSKSK
jgi:hypothetical protein